MLVEGAAACHDAAVAALQVLEGIEDANLSIVCPVAFVAVVHVLDVLYLVIAKHGEAAGGLYAAKVVHVSQSGPIGCLAGNDLAIEAKATLSGRTLHVSIALALQSDVSIAHEGGLDFCLGTHTHLSVDGWHVEVAPIDADAVAFPCQDGLLDRTCTHVTHTFFHAQAGHSSLRDAVNALHGSCLEVKLHVVLLTICGTHLIRDVVDGDGNQVVVIDQHGGGEDQIEFHGAALHRVVGVGSQHIHALLLCHLHVVHLGAHVLVEAVIRVGTSSGVVAVGSDHVLAFVEKVLDLAIHMQHDAIHPGLACLGYAGAIDKELEHIVVRVLQIEVLVELVGCQLYGAAHVDVAVLGIPNGIDVLQVA